MPARLVLVAVASAALLVAAVVAVVVLLAPVVSPGAKSGSADPEARQAQLHALHAAASDAVIAERVPADAPGCSAAVALSGDVVWAGAGGLADLEAGTPVTTTTRFEIASVAKQFTATAILMLQREGLLSVHDPIGGYIEGLPDWALTVTLDQLIHHTSRIPDFWVELDAAGIGFGDPADQRDTVEAIARTTELEPGEGYLYSNANYVLLAEVVEAVTGTALPEFLATRVFEPLGLDMVVAPGLRAEDMARSYDDDNELQEPGWTAYGHIGIVTTPSELARWGDQYRAGDIVQPDFREGAVDEGAGERYAAGIDLEVDGDLNHTGRWGGYVSEFTVSADRLITITVMCNGHAADRWGITDTLWDIWDPLGADPPSRD